MKIAEGIVLSDPVIVSAADLLLKAWLLDIRNMPTEDLAGEALAMHIVAAMNLLKKFEDYIVLSEADVDEENMN